MIKRENYDEEINHDRWLISYSDFMTLLLAFFVVLYSVSQVSEQKYKQLSDTLSAAFNPTFLEDNQGETPSKILSDSEILALDEQSLQYAESNGSTDDQIEAQFKNKEFQEISEQLQQSFASLIDNELITLSGDEQWLQIEMQSAILFDSGGAELNQAANAILSELTEALNDHNNVIRVEGFTDNVPISTQRFLSNWELSTARATAVVRLMETQGVASNRLAAVGYGEHQPVANNQTAEGRARNRRIVLMVSTSESLRPDVENVEAIFIGADAQVINPNASGEVSQFELSAKEQAQAWFKRMNEIVDAAPSGDELAPAEQALPSSEDNSAVNTQIDEANTVEPAAEPVTQPAEGVRRIELEDGSLLFTNDA